MRWAVIAIDWNWSNVIAWWDDEEAAKQSVERYASLMDELSLRAIAVPEGDPRIREEVNEPR